MKKVLDIYQEKIDTLEQEKKKYSNDTDQYSWYIANDEQKTWKEALKILSESKDYNFSLADVEKLNNWIEGIRDLIFVIDEVYCNDVPKDVLEAMEKAEGSLIMINALMNARLNSN